MDEDLAPSPDGSTAREDVSSDAAERRRGVPLWLALALSIVIVTLALLTASLVCGPLSVIVSPPMPPIYPGARQLSAAHEDYGVDSWQYRTDADACAVLDFYRRESDRCMPVLPGFCDAARTPPPNADAIYVTRCVGRGQAGTFSWSWKATLREVFAEGDPYTELTLSRTMYWGTSAE